MFEEVGMKTISGIIVTVFVACLLFVTIFAGISNAQTKLTGTVFSFILPQQTQWQTSVAAPFQVNAFTGQCDLGVVAFGGEGNRKAAYIKDLALGSWQNFTEAPFSVSGCSGGNDFGPIIFGGANNRQVAYMRKYAENLWKTLADAPFDIIDMTGDNNFGPVIVGGPDSKKIAFMRKFAENTWESLPDAPFSVRAIAGNNEKGIIIAGGNDNRQIAIYNILQPANWKALADAPFSIINLGGSFDYGPIVIGGSDGRQVAMMTSYRENRWDYGAQLPVAANCLVGANNIGMVVCSLPGHSNGAASTASQQKRKNILKTAVVGFSERGNLGIQDAGEIIAEWMIPALNKTGAFEVYERLSLDKVVQEHALGQSGMVSDEAMAQIGKLRGVQVIITGSVIKFGDVISVTAKVIDVETAKIIDTADIKVTDVNAISNEIDKLAWELAKE